MKVRAGETPSPTRETHALPRQEPPPSNDFLWRVSIVGCAMQPEVSGKSVELIKLVPHIASFFLSHDLLQEFVTFVVHVAT